MLTWAHRASAENTLLLVVRSVTAQYRMYRVDIAWNAPATARPPHQLPALPPPKIGVTPLKVLGCLLEDLQGGLVQTLPDAPQLSHLELVPYASGPDPSEQSSTTLLAAFSHLPHSNAPDESATYSIVTRWDISSALQRLHHSFGQLASKKHSPSSAYRVGLDVHAVVRADKALAQQALHVTPVGHTRVEKLLLSIHPLSSNTVLALAFGDGSIEFRDRSTMDLITPTDDLQHVASLTQVGFVFPAEHSCERAFARRQQGLAYLTSRAGTHVALSPNSCLGVSLDLEGVASLKTMQYARGELDDTTDEGTLRR